jgi:hypothetical protein
MNTKTTLKLNASISEVKKNIIDYERQILEKGDTRLSGTIAIFSHIYFENDLKNYIASKYDTNEIKNFLDRKITAEQLSFYFD